MARVDTPTVDKTDELAAATFHIRGKEYKVLELISAEYEDLVKQASDEEEGTTDTALLSRLLTLAAVKIDGKDVPENWFTTEKYPVTNRVANEVKRIHWVELETDEEVEERTKEERDAARKAAREAAKAVPNS